MTDVKKRVCARRQHLRIRIENLEITRDRMKASTMEFNPKSINKSIERAKRELHMLETQWKF